jgi:hypothetical protein
VKQERESSMKRKHDLKSEAAIPDLDAKLVAPEQRMVAEAVRNLRDEPVSLVWRSELNERLLEVASVQRRKRRVAWVLRPALGLALAGVVVMTIMFGNTPNGPTLESGANMEAALLKAHHEAVTARDLVGAGLTASEFELEADQRGGSGSSDAQKL